MTRLRVIGMLMRPVVATIGLALFGLALLVAMPLFLWHAAVDLVARSIPSAYAGLDFKQITWDRR